MPDSSCRNSATTNARKSLGGLLGKAACLPFEIHTSCSGFVNGSGRSSSVFTMLNTVALAPIPSPAIRTTNT